MSDARMIAVDCRDRAQELREQITALQDEVDRLLRAAEVLDPGMTSPEELSAEAEAVYAPWGFKKDGSPRRRPVPRPETQAKAAATRRAKAEALAARAEAVSEELRLNVLSSTRPSQRELQDREVVHVTQEPA